MEQIKEGLKKINNKNSKVLLCTVPQRIKGRQKSNSNFVNFPPPLAIMSLFDWMEKFGYSGEFYDIHLLLPSNDEIHKVLERKLPSYMQ